jgi:hypothetical protein
MVRYEQRGKIWTHGGEISSVFRWEVVLFHEIDAKCGGKKLCSTGFEVVILSGQDGQIPEADRFPTELPLAPIATPLCRMMLVR